LGVKGPNNNIYFSPHQHPHQQQQQAAKSFSYVREPTFYSVQKPQQRVSNVTLDIHNLKIKNERNYSV
jgi:hypothetical protein